MWSSGRLSWAATRWSTPAQIRETSDLEIPVSTPVR